MKKNTTKNSDEDIEARLIARSTVAMAKDYRIGERYVSVFYFVDAMLSGNIEKARDGVVSILRTGQAPELVQLLAADLLEQDRQSRSRGRPGHLRPSRWQEIGSACERKREEKPRVKNIPAVIAQELAVSESEVKRADAFYCKVMRYTDEELEKVRVRK